MESPPAAPRLNPFTNNDMFRSFVSGALWGGAAIGFLAVGAWLVSIMRKRVVVQSSESRERDFHLLVHGS